MKRTPMDVLHDLMLRGFMLGKMSTYWKPGGIVEHTSDEDRELLKELTSDDTAKMRPDVWIRSNRREK